MLLDRDELRTPNLPDIRRLVGAAHPAPRLNLELVGLVAQSLRHLRAVLKLDSVDEAKYCRHWTHWSQLIATIQALGVSLVIHHDKKGFILPANERTPRCEEHASSTAHKAQGAQSARSCNMMVPRKRLPRGYPGSDPVQCRLWQARFASCSRETSTSMGYLAPIEKHFPAMGSL